jgi:hypothetical protein
MYTSQFQDLWAPLPQPWSFVCVCVCVCVCVWVTENCGAETYKQNTQLLKLFGALGGLCKAPSLTLRKIKKETQETASVFIMKGFRICLLFVAGLDLGYWLRCQRWLGEKGQLRCRRAGSQYWTVCPAEPRRAGEEGADLRDPVLRTLGDVEEWASEICLAPVSITTCLEMSFSSSLSCLYKLKQLTGNTF